MSPRPGRQAAAPADRPGRQRPGRQPADVLVRRGSPLRRLRPGSGAAVVSSRAREAQAVGSGARRAGRRVQALQDLQRVVAVLPGQARQDRVTEDPRQHGLAEDDRVGAVLPVAPGSPAPGPSTSRAGQPAKCASTASLNASGAWPGCPGHDRGQPAHVRPGLGRGAGRLVGGDGPRPQLVRRGRVAPRDLLLVERHPVPGDVRACGVAGHRVDGQQDVDHPGLHRRRLRISHHVYLPRTGARCPVDVTRPPLRPGYRDRGPAPGNESGNLASRDTSSRRRPCQASNSGTTRSDGGTEVRPPGG